MMIMKKFNMPKGLWTIAFMTAFTLAASPTYGQVAAATAEPARASAAGPIVEHLKVENGSIWIRPPGQAMVDTHQAPDVGHAVKTLQTLYPDVTFAVDPRVAKVALADVIIRANDPMTDLAALCTASGDRFSVRQEPNSLYTLECNNFTDADPKNEDRTIECFNLTGYIGAIIPSEDGKEQPKTEADKDHARDLRRVQTSDALAELQEIINRTIADFDNTIKEPHFRFYPQAQLLIVTGSHRAIEVAAKVIHALPGQQWGHGNASWGRNIGDQDPMQERQQSDAMSGRGPLIPPGTTTSSALPDSPADATARRP
jgi:hypothetical protein